jgi:zinc D-Ala-D-Ala dipeptidase
MTREAGIGSRRVGCASFPLVLTLAFASLAAFWPAWAQPIARGALPQGFVYLRDVDPTIAQDMRYASADSFVGRPLPGYDAPECVLRRDVAAALKQVQADLAPQGLSLKVYDCYRPTRAVRAMAQWAGDRHAGGATKRYFPNLQKENLFALGYISARSEHSAGTTIDLTLIENGAKPAPAFNPAATYGACTGPAEQRSPDNSIDMGTGYDCFDVASHTSSGAINAEQRRWRNTLVNAMSKRGFRNYHREWWHFTYRHAGPSAQYDFPIRPRTN